MPVDGGLIGPATLGMTQGVTLFQSFLPKFTDIRKADPANNPDFVKDVRMGELAASLLTIGLGAMMSGLTGSAVPSVVAVLASAGLILLYETALMSNASKPDAEHA